ncbi:MAG: twin-arginine translocation signal domain-containing protein [Patescibacteria group bacterium]|nr:twin-arginine translocation signal domain-containing protein [Patescibacteria group bacterium]MCL5432107.1 twin-arginine translocation signal domain-containing protein [Patescibacteria group bacterium]
MLKTEMADSSQQEQQGNGPITQPENLGISRRGFIKDMAALGALVGMGAVAGTKIAEAQSDQTSNTIVKKPETGPTGGGEVINFDVSAREGGQLDFSGANAGDVMQTGLGTLLEPINAREGKYKIKPCSDALLEAAVSKALRFSIAPVSDNVQVIVVDSIKKSRQVNGNEEVTAEGNHVIVTQNSGQGWAITESEPWVNLPSSKNDQLKKEGYMPVDGPTSTIDLIRANKNNPTLIGFKTAFIPSTPDGSIRFSTTLMTLNSSTHQLEAAP